MEGANQNGKVCGLLRESRVFADEPFVLIDVGCSGGLHPMWRVFGEDLVAFGFDPQQSECERLQAAETNPRVQYYASYVGLKPSHSFMMHRSRCRRNVASSFGNAFFRLPRRSSEMESCGIVESAELH